MTESRIEPSHSLFQQPWWLDAVAPGQWSEARIEQDGVVKARLPFVERRKWGLKVITHPRLSQTLGPWNAPIPGKSSRRLAEEKHLCHALIDQLPECDYFSQAFHPSVTNCLPWQWRGFSERILYTYQLDDLSDLDLVWRNFGDCARNQVRKAQQQLEVDYCADLETILDVNDLTFARQGLKAPYSRDYVRRIEAACGPRNASIRLAAVDARGRVHAVNYLVLDGRSSHGLLLGSDPELRNSGAGTLLVWEAIRMVAKVAPVFDFGGSMIEPVETFFRNFGARQVTYHHLSRMSRRMKLLMAARDIAHLVRGRS